MKRNIRNCVIIGLFSFWVAGVAFGQKNPTQLGEEVFNHFRADNLDKLKEYIPSSTEAIKIAESIGFKLSNKEIENFLEHYPSEVQQFENRLKNILEEGKKMGIDWDLTTLKFVDIIHKEQTINSDSDRRTINSSNLDIHFTFLKQDYVLEFNAVFELSGEWFLGGDRPALRREYKNSNKG